MIVSNPVFEELTNKETDIVKEWVSIDDLELIKHDKTVYAWPRKIATGFKSLLENLNVVYSGVRLGELVRDKMVPDHALALSTLSLNRNAGVDLNYKESIQFLQRKELKLDNSQNGWQLVRYRGHNLGWINVLPNRINNYYPKELRILKDSH